MVRKENILPPQSTFLGESRMSPANKSASTFDDTVATLVEYFAAIEDELALDSRGNPEGKLNAPLPQFEADWV